MSEILFGALVSWFYSCFYIIWLAGVTGSGLYFDHRLSIACCLHSTVCMIDVTWDQLIALQCDDPLDESVHARIRLLSSRRRGCRAGEHVKRRLLLCRHAAGDAVDGHIPTTVGNRPVAARRAPRTLSAVNSVQLYTPTSSTPTTINTCTPAARLQPPLPVLTDAGLRLTQPPQSTADVRSITATDNNTLVGNYKLSFELSTVN